MTLLAATVVLGVLAGALLVKQTDRPIDASRLVSEKRWASEHGKASAADGKARALAGKGAAGKHDRGRVMVASRRAIREIYAPVTFSGVVNRLFSKKPAAYQFQPEVYEPKAGLARKAKAPRAKLGAAKLDEEDAVEPPAEDPPAEEPPAEEPPAEEPPVDPLDEEYPEGWDDEWDNQEVHLWSDRPPGSDDDEAGDVEIMDIVMYDLPVFIFFMALLLYIEVTACLWRRGRDFLLATAAWRGNDEAFKTQCAKESQVMIYRPYISWFAVIGLWLVVKDSIDVYGKCFFNLECFLNLDCHVRILLPAEAECVFDIMLPAAVVTGVLICGVLAAIWGFTRPWASLVLIGTFFSGVFAIWTVSLFACTLWVLCAVGFNYFYFYMLPYIEDSPAWCEDLGSLAFATNPRTGAVRDGDKTQHWKEDPDGTLQPTKSELETLFWVERFAYHVADFYHTHLRGLRVIWNGVFMRGLVLGIVGRRTRVFGEEHIKHLGSHDKVLVAGNHRTYFDFWVITVCGLWAKAGVTLFSFYPVRSTWVYTNFGGMFMNMSFSSYAMFPPIMNTPSDKKNDDTRIQEEANKWNDYAIRRVISDLKSPGVLCGMHPEGTRNTSEDPYDIAAAKPGIGRVALETPDAHLVPVFVMGVEPDVWGMFKKNFADKPLEDPIDIVFGPRIDVSDLRQKLKDGAGAKEDIWAEAGDRVADAIKQLAAAHPRLAQELRDKEEAERNRRYQGENPNEAVSAGSV